MIGQAREVTIPMDRLVLAPLVDALFRGITIEVSGVQACYRASGELLPGVVGGPFEPALSSGIFRKDVAQESSWGFAGGFEDLAVVLDLDGVVDAGTQLAMALALRKANDVGLNRSIPVRIHVRPGQAPRGSAEHLRPRAT